MYKLISILFLFICSYSVYGQQARETILLSDYEDVVIATDLEPDDVLALKLIFKEANRLYHQDLEKKYPIQLILVGEGNSSIKKLRMEALINGYFEVPEEVEIEVKEAKSTSDNLFPYDGEELFNREQLLNYPYLQTCEGADSLIQFVERSQRPLIIQLKPVQELVALSLYPALSRKTTVLLYGSFNLRKTLRDEEVIHSLNFISDEPLSFQLEVLLQHFAQNFEKIGIIESYGVLGDQSSVYFKFPWTNPIAEYIQQSHDPFYPVFTRLVSNWNRYLFEEELKEIRASLDSLIHAFPQEQRKVMGILEEVDRFIAQCSENTFDSLSDQISSLVTEFSSKGSSETEERLDRLKRQLNFAAQIEPRAGLQFTLSDVIVALALSDHSAFFTATPVKVIVNQQGYLSTSPQADSNVFYYDRKDHQPFAETLIQQLESNSYLQDGQDRKDRAR